MLRHVVAVSRLAQSCATLSSLDPAQGVIIQLWQLDEIITAARPTAGNGYRFILMHSCIAVRRDDFQGVGCVCPAPPRVLAPVLYYRIAGLTLCTRDPSQIAYLCNCLSQGCISACNLESEVDSRRLQHRSRTRILSGA